MIGLAGAASPTPPLGRDEWLPTPVAIDAVQSEIEHVATYHLRFLDPSRAAAYTFRPGQFNMLYLPGVGEAAISLSGHDPLTRCLLHTVRSVGRVTYALSRLAPGATIGLRGPYGRGWPLDALTGRDVLLVAGGIGLAPLRSLIEHIAAQRDRFDQVRVLYGARSPSAMLYERDYARWRGAGIEWTATVDRATPEWTGHVGVVTLLIEQATDLNLERTVVCGCGPEVMMHFVARALLARGLAADRIWFALERHMQCAVGWCGHCLLGPEFICRDGPVLNYSRVARWLKVEGL